MDSPVQANRNRDAQVFALCTAIAVIAGIVHASFLTYLSDDSFVAFRYARNLLNGLGLVYNAGERVEGYTNFLWTLIIALGMKFHAAPETFSTVVGIGFFAMTILVWSWMSWKIPGATGWRRLPLPLTALALAAHRDICAHATSGMETSLITFLVTLIYALMLFGSSRRRTITVGFLFVLAMMTRPDAIVFLAGAAIYYLLTSSRPLRRLFDLLLPAILLFLPYWLWRWNYYGYFFPNTFYAKSVSLSYYTQGLVYLFLYFKTYYVFGLLLILACVGVWRKRSILAGKAFMAWVREELRRDPPRSHPILLGTLFAGGYIFFIVRLGGDFMFARFLIPITPVLFFMMEVLIVRFAPGRWRPILAGLVVAATLFRYDQYRDNSFVGYIADERRYFTVDEPLSRSVSDAATFRKYLDGLPVRVAFWAGQLRLVYYADFPLAIESSAGLMDTAIAHRVIHTRGRPGHEKNATFDYLESREVNFYIGPTALPPPGAVVLNAIVFDSLRARIIVYKNDVMTTLARYPEVKFVRLPEYLDNYIAGIDSLPDAKVAQDYAFLRPFYFDHNTDSVREEAFLQRLLSGARRK